MKLMRKNWKDRSAVSPVIATILMVAITVVLAAVLYVMVMGFGGDSGTTPAGQITKVEETSTGVYKLTLSSFSPETKFTDLKVNVGGTAYGLVVSDTGAITGNTGTVIGGLDLANDGIVSQGDYLTLTVTITADTAVSIVHVPSGGLIAEKTLVA